MTMTMMNLMVVMKGLSRGFFGLKRFINLRFYARQQQYCCSVS